MSDIEMVGPHTYRGLSHIGLRLLTVARAVGDRAPGDIQNQEDPDWDRIVVDGGEVGPVVVMAKIDHEVKFGLPRNSGVVMANRTAIVDLMQRGIRDRMSAKWVAGPLRSRIASANIEAVLANTDKETGRTALVVDLSQAVGLVTVSRFCLGTLTYTDDDADQYDATYTTDGWRVPKRFTETLARAEYLLGMTRSPPKRR
jgi:hypothetical protein